MNDGFFDQRVRVPVNTTAYCYVVSLSAEDVWVNGVPFPENMDVLSYKLEGNELVLELGSGSYEIRTKRE